jgi:hypothetical protein
MKLLKIILIVACTLMAYDWVNTSGGAYLTLADIIPFSHRQPSFTYNYAALVMIGFASYGIWRLYGRKRF